MNFYILPEEEKMDQTISTEKRKRSNSLFYPPTHSEDEVTPKKYRRIRSRHHKQVQPNSPVSLNNDQSFITSQSKEHTFLSLNSNNCNDDVDVGLDITKDDENLSSQRCRKVPTTFGAERSHCRSTDQATNSDRNESIWSYPSNTNRLIEDVEKLKELIFLRDIQLGFLPDDCEVEFESCFKRLSQDERFAVSRKIRIFYQNKSIKCLEIVNTEITYPMMLV